MVVLEKRKPPKDNYDIFNYIDGQRTILTITLQRYETHLLTADNVAETQVTVLSSVQSSAVEKEYPHCT